MTRGVDEAALERAVREELDRESSLFAEGLGVFRGRRTLAHAGAAVLTFVVFGFAVYAVVRLLGASSVDERVLWSTATVGSLVFVMGLKVYFWLQMVRHAVLREVKRVELRVSELDRE